MAKRRKRKQRYTKASRRGFPPVPLPPRRDRVKLSPEAKKERGKRQAIEEETRRLRAERKLIKERKEHKRVVKRSRPAKGFIGKITRGLSDRQQRSLSRDKEKTTRAKAKAERLRAETDLEKAKREKQRSEGRGRPQSPLMGGLFSTGPEEGSKGKKKKGPNSLFSF